MSALRKTDVIRLPLLSLPPLSHVLIALQCVQRRAHALHRPEIPITNYSNMPGSKSGAWRSGDAVRNAARISPDNVRERPHVVSNALTRLPDARFHRARRDTGHLCHLLVRVLAGIPEFE